MRSLSAALNLAKGRFDVSKHETNILGLGSPDEQKQLD